MKVETPQLRWHQIINPQSQKDAGANGPILSCSLLSNNNNNDSSISSNMGVLATAGNTEVNLWRVRFTENDARRTTSSDASSSSKSLSSHILVQPQTKNTTSKGPTAAASNVVGGKIDLTNDNNDDATTPTISKPIISEHTQIEHIVTLSRGTNERGINAVKFSPSGQHLVAAGDGGTVVVWSLPTQLQSTNDSGNGTGTSPSTYWSAIEKETDLPLKILFNQSDDIMDLAWSSDSKRFSLCSLDHTMTVWELHTNGEWRTVHRSAKDHTHYIQGVAYDPKGVYLASMGSDRMVKVYMRKGMKDGVVKGELAKYEVDKSESEAEKGEDAGGNAGGDQNAILQSKVLPELLTNSTFALQNKIKTMKFLKGADSNNDKDASSKEESSSTSNSNNATSAKRHHMFADELTLGSFFRRLAFTPDGAFLVVPAALWHGRGNDKSATSSTNSAPASPTSVANTEDKLAESSFATYLFARHHFDQPYKVLTGLEKPSVVVRPNPVLFQLPPNKKGILPYRSVFAVLTNDTVLIYDTHHNHPLAMARGLHYAGLTDAAWSNDGKTLFVTSSDGYISILSFGDGELGKEYVATEVKIVEKAGSSGTGSEVVSGSNNVGSQDTNTGIVVNTLIAKKKKKVTPTASSDGQTDGSAEKKHVTFGEPVDDRSNQPLVEPITQQPVVINTLVAKKKKKKIAPTLVTPAQQEQSSGEGVSAESTTEKKRSVEEVAKSSTEPQAVAPVNILQPKKKKKVASSSSPIATM